MLQAAQGHSVKIKEHQCSSGLQGCVSRLAAVRHWGLESGSFQVPCSTSGISRAGSCGLFTSLELGGWLLSGEMMVFSRWRLWVQVSRKEGLPGLVRDLTNLSKTRPLPATMPAEHDLFFSDYQFSNFYLLREKQKNKKKKALQTRPSRTLVIAANCRAPGTCLHEVTTKQIFTNFSN